jgi:hypothetical protein
LFAICAGLLASYKLNSVTSLRRPANSRPPQTINAPVQYA